MKSYGLIGFPLSHSFSASYFKNKFEKEKITNSQYLNFEIDDIEKLNQIISANPDLIGLNVTIPYKEKVIPFLHKLDETAQEIAAVNTIKIFRQGNSFKLKGYNTDVYGFKETLKPLLRNNHHKALILGTGGAAKAVEYVLKNIGLEVIYISRNPEKENEKSYAELNEVAIKNFPVIVNSSPLGMYPKIDVCPEIPYQFINENNLLYDLIYNPEETLFLKKGKEKGALTQNGLSMLQLQAEKAYEIWTSENYSF